MNLEWIKDRLNAMSLFWKVYAFIVTLLVFVVGLAEGVLEPFTKRILEKIYGDFHVWHEAVIWAVSIVVPSLISGYILSKMLSGKLEKMAKASKALARGNLEVRLTEKGGSKDAFVLLAQSFNQMAIAVKMQQHYGRRLLADISHELRSPLTRMLLATDLLGRKHKDEESVSITLRLEKEVRQMNELVSLLLEQTRDKFLSSGLNGATNLAEILAELTDNFSFQGEIRNIRIQSSVTGNLMIYGNTLLLERMIGNILSNSIFYSPKNSVIKVDAKLEGEEIQVAIRDYGPGVPEDQLEEIFRAFYRVDNSRDRASGNVGLGLALAREVALQHGGNIVASNAHPGLCATVTLPAYFPEDEE